MYYKIIAVSLPLFGRGFVENFGGESAFTVSVETNRCRESYGNSFLAYPCNLGDVENLGPAISAVSISRKSAKYTAAAGPEGAKAAVAWRIGKLLGIDPNTVDIAIEPAKSAIFNFFNSQTQAGDTVLGPKPGYPMYSSNASGHDLTEFSYSITLREDGRTAIDFPGLYRATDGKRLDVVVINDVHNPTGHCMTHEEVEKMIAFLDLHSEAKVLLDIAYEALRFSPDESPIKRLAQHIHAQGRLVVVWTFSKEGAFPGARIGAIAYPKTHPEAIRSHVKMIGNGNSCPVHPFMDPLAETLNMPKFLENIEVNKARLKERVEYALPILRSIFGEENVAAPGGGFYIWVKADDFLRIIGMPGRNESARRLILRQTGVSYTQGSHFGLTENPGNENYIRFAISSIPLSSEPGLEAGTPTLEAGLTTLQTWMTSRVQATRFWQDKKVVVLGGGSIGKHVAGNHALYGGGDVTLVTRNAAALRDGYTIEFPSGKELAKPKIAETVAEIPEADVVYVCTQKGKLPAGLEKIITKKTHIIVMQNGVDAGQDVVELFHNNPVSLCEIYVQTRGSNDNNCGISIPRENKWVLGSVCAENDASSEIAAMLAPLGFRNMQSLPHHEHVTSRWTKFLNNLANFACLILASQGKGPTYGDLLGASTEAASARALVKSALTEAIAIAKSNDVSFPKEDYFSDILTYVASDHIPTTVANYRDGKPIEDLLSIVIEMGQRANCNVSALRQLQELVTLHNQSPAPHPGLKQVVQNHSERLSACLAEPDSHPN